MLKPRNQFSKLYLPLLGTLIDYYDYGLYGFAAIALSQHFFPSHDPLVSLLKIYGSFALGSLAKPLGGFFFGYMADFKGRRVALSRSLMGIYIPTLIIALLPSYETFGWAAPCCLILCRFLQGFFISGEYDSASVYIYEHMEKQKGYFCYGLLGVASMTGIFLASSIYTFITTFVDSHEGWRYCFLLGAFAGIILLPFRKKMIEPPSFSLSSINKKFKPTLNHLKAFFIYGGIGGLYHLLIIFTPSFYGKIMGIFPTQMLLTFTSLCLFVYILSTLASGMILEKYAHERQKFICVSILFLSVGSILLILGENHTIKLACILILVMLLPFISIFTGITALKSFPSEIRGRSIFISHALGSFALSGSTPFWLTLIWSHFHMESPIYVYLLFLCLTVTRSALTLNKKGIEKTTQTDIHMLQ